jgi:hypothetical protein
MFTTKLKTRTAMLYADARARLSLAFFQNIQKSTTINTVRVAQLDQTPRPRNRMTKLRPRYTNGGTTAIMSKSNSWSSRRFRSNIQIKPYIKAAFRIARNIYSYLPVSVNADLRPGIIALLTGGNGFYAMRTSYETFLFTNYSTPRQRWKALPLAHPAIDLLNRHSQKEPWTIELRDRHPCVARNWYFYDALAPMLVFEKVSRLTARKLPVASGSSGSMVPIHVKPDRSSFEFRWINRETLPQFPRRLPHDGGMNDIAKYATKEMAMSG